jgi:alkenylglycerophosphocholine hydrolase
MMRAHHRFATGDEQTRYVIWSLLQTLVHCPAPPGFFLPALSYAPGYRGSLMLQILGLAAAISGSAAIVVDWRETKPLAFLVLKPLTTLLIAGIAWLAPESAYRSLLLLALMLSLAGDICLMFASNRAFIGGLSSFLLAHLAFMAAFLIGLPAFPLPWWALLFAVYGLAFALLLLPRAGALKLPVLVYGLVLVGMGVTASIRYAALGTSGALLALIGAVLFLVSDSALGTRKFVGHYRGAQGLILSTYWLSIGLIAASALDV